MVDASPVGGQAPGTPTRAPRETPRSFFRRNAPLFALIGMSITFAELLTGSTPVLRLFLDPLSLPFLVGLYGVGVLLIREGSIRWRLPWPSILALGAGYGIVEEAFGTKTFFDAHEIGLLGVYGHWAGVNWVWAVQLTIFHAVFSIGLPILLLPLWFPAVRGVRLVSDRGMGWAAIVFVSTVVFMFALFDPGYAVPLGILLVTLVVVVACGAVGFGLSRATGRTSTGDNPRRSVRAMTTAGILFVWSFFAINWIGPSQVHEPWILIGLMIGLCIGMLVFLRGQARLPGNERAMVGLAVGLLSFLLVLAGLLGTFGDYGAIPVVALVLYLLWVL